MIKREDFTSAKCCQKRKVNKLMVNVFSAVHYFKLIIKMNVSTVPRVHMLLITSAHSCCLRRFIPRLITVSFQSKSLRSILCCIWPFSLYGNISDACIYAVLSCTRETLLVSTPETMDILSSQLTALERAPSLFYSVCCHYQRRRTGRNRKKNI